MAEMPAVRRVRLSDAARVRSIRLEALTDPVADIAYLETRAEAESRPDEYWRERTAGAALSGTAAQLLERHGIIDIDVVGLATDYCVRASALDAIEHGRHVRVFTDLVAGVHPDSSAKALAEIAHAGAQLIESDG